MHDNKKTLVFSDSFTPGLNFRQELRTVFKFGTHINAIECSNEEEETLKEQLEEAILKNSEEKIDNKVKDFVEKTVANQRRLRSPRIGAGIPNPKREGKTEYLSEIKFEEGWHLGGNGNSFVRVDDERMKQLIENSEFLNLGESNVLGESIVSAHAQKIDLDDLLKVFGQNKENLPRYDPIFSVNKNEEKLSPTGYDSTKESGMEMTIKPLSGVAPKNLGVKRVEVKPRFNVKESAGLQKLTEEALEKLKNGEIKVQKKPTKKKSAKKSAKKKTSKKKVGKKKATKKKRKTNARRKTVS